MIATPKETQEESMVVLESTTHGTVEETQLLTAHFSILMVMRSIHQSKEELVSSILPLEPLETTNAQLRSPLRRALLNLLLKLTFQRMCNFPLHHLEANTTSSVLIKMDLYLKLGTLILGGK